MDLVTYQPRAHKLAVYPRIGNNIDYPLVGLMEELGELTSKLLEDGDYGDKLCEAERESGLLEAGDVLWYFNAFLTEAKLSLAECHAGNAIYGEVPQDCTKEEIAHELLTVLQRLSGLCGQVKRLHRDDVDVLTDVRRDAIKTHSAKFMHAFTSACFVMGFTVDQVTAANIAKLESRQQRGVLHGSGDNR